MGRRKIEIKAIKDDRNRSVTFLKRKGGLFKKAHELSVLCSVDVAVIIFGTNKKLYEFSSGDINETVTRFSYYAGPHEHKGPGDYNGGGGDDDDDDDDASPPTEDISRQGSMPPHPHHQQAVASGYMRGATATPPPQNMMPGDYGSRQHTPQPFVNSRQDSRQAMRRSSLGPGPSHLQHMSHPSHESERYAYSHGAPPPPAYMGHAGMAPQQGTSAAYYHQLQQASQQNYIQAQRQQASMASAQEYRNRHHSDASLRHQQSQSHDSMPSPTQAEPQGMQGGEPRHSQRSSQRTKSRSIFTPIDGSRSLLAQHWGAGRSSTDHRARDAQRPEPIPEAENAATQSDSNSAATPTQPSRYEGLPPARSYSTDTTSSIRGDAAANAKRPKLTVHIPEEQPDTEEGEAANNEEASVEGAAGDSNNASASESKSNTRRHSISGQGSGRIGSAPPSASVEKQPRFSSNKPAISNGVVLPPPSPSASALLSAGASGPPNPFARPLPPNNKSFDRPRSNSTTTIPNSVSQAGATSSNSTDPNKKSVGGKDNETPISALPSRFVSDALLPSPSAFYPEWSFGRTGGESANILPSPLNFQTPIAHRRPSFSRDEDADKKRKTPPKDDVPRQDKAQGSKQIGSTTSVSKKIKT